eukprot:CAMPEP_0176478292 /NCGR_PEP_ID=MMETSP0200_2-20121128/1108_1 /TAXON_ID=947934 /ORGANISM="Chaetoceros sp., Strain GSL56" /LENGTH=478 /DNA_ID=CAMNT_0017874219 /DNA_START=97 /DNA_END=1533 /DNA_ORIENTATION=+
MEFIERNQQMGPSLSSSKIRMSTKGKTQASLFNTRRHRSKNTSFSKRILVFLVSISLFRSSGDQGGTSFYDHSASHRPNTGLTFLLAAGATVSAAAANTEQQDEKQNKDRIMGGKPKNPPSEKPFIQSMTSTMMGTSGKKNVTRSTQSVDPKTNSTSFSQILKKAGKIGMGGGVPGFIAGVIQVITLMWLRTVMNYQCRYGASFPQALRILYSEGGIPRFYRGLSFALIQAPLSRFVATATNDGVETLLANLKVTQDWGPGRSTVIASIIVGLWRMILMPIDTCKTVLQVDSVEGFRNLMRKVKAGKIYVLYQGAIANAASAVVGHYPWFYTYRVLSKSQLLHKLISSNHLRNASIGFTASVVSDTVANAIRVVKTTKQAIASKHAVSYGEVISMILAADGWKGLFGRGLRTRILGNAVQSVLFTVVWRGLAERKNRQGQNDTSTRQMIKTTQDEFDDTVLSSGQEGLDDLDAVQGAT